ncbi:MAG: hypothetical protein IKJ35_04325 [Clostridia bacterium]|nr:hypothetical protein [Clostridia bacterium]
MMQSSSRLWRTFIRVTYLLPALFGLIMLICFFVPHVFFLYNGKPQATCSPFELMCNTWDATIPALSSEATSSGTVYFFALTMVIVTVISWICVFTYASMAISSAICSTVAFFCVPSDRLANRAKRWMHFFCPNRVMYVISNLLLLLPAAFPYLLGHFYRSQLGYDMRAYFIGASDLILAVIFVILSVSAFLALLPMQAREEMDMYRLNKSKKNEEK